MTSFINSNRPILTAMIKSRKKGDILNEIEKILDEGTDAFGFQLEIFEEAHSEENLKDIFQAMRGKPVYVTNYLRWNADESKKNDDILTEELYLAAQCGATLIDVRGDTFDPCHGELTYKESAVERQTKFIKELHAIGAEVLMSSHILEFTPTHTVLEYALAQQSRGADIAKIVTAANTPEELNENFRIITELKEKLKISSLFLCGGECCRRHRLLGPVLGCSMYLVRENSAPHDNQPTIKDAKTLLSALEYSDLP